jgi:hypothetical protein
MNSFTPFLVTWRRRCGRLYLAERQLESGTADVFGLGGDATTQPFIDVKTLHAKIGELTLENQGVLAARAARRPSAHA